MRNTSVSTFRKILLLASVLILMLTLCGCRTRITNNDEVSNVMYDEEGYRQEEYNMRRDDLGLGKAPKPIFTGLGAPEEDYGEYDYGSDSQALEDYDPEAYEEPYEEPEEETSAGTSSSGSGSAGGGSGRVIRRNSSSGNSSKKNTSEVEVVLDANGGTINGKNSITVEIEKDGDYDALPSPDERAGYAFDGWFTKKDGGTNVGGRKLASTKKHKLYAHWKKNEAAPEPDKKTFTVTFDPNGGEISHGEPSQTVEEGSTASAPVAVREGYNFLSWFSAAEGGDKYDEAAKITQDQTWFAQWERDWDKTFTDAADKITSEDKIDCYIEDSSNGKKNLVDACKGNVLDDADTKNSYCVVRFIDDISEDKAVSAKDEILSNEKYTGKELKVLLIDAEAIEGNDKTKLAYKMAILNKIYGVPDSSTVSEGASDLGYSGDLSKKIYMY